MPVNLNRLRRELEARGLTPASAVPEASGGRTDDACIRLAQLLEGDALEWRSVGAAQHWPDPLAFLDGVQRSRLLAYAGSAPIVVGEVAAAVRERRDRRLVTVAEDRRLLAFGRASALEAAGDLLEQFQLVPLEADQPPHPVRDLASAARALEKARTATELDIGQRFRARSDGWLVVDGSLTESPSWSTDQRVVGISKSHATLPFDGPDLDRYLRIPCGHRSSLYAPQTRSLTPVHAWALRIWPWEGKDLFHGLIRVEVAPENGTTEMADALSRWLLAERAPLSTPDKRWDRLLYGIRSVETYLHSRALHL